MSQGWMAPRPVGLAHEGQVQQRHEEQREHGGEGQAPHDAGCHGSPQQAVAAQGKKDFDPEAPPLSALSFDIKAASSGTVIAIDNVQLARIARSAGAPRAKGSGVDLMVKLGEQVIKGQLLYKVYAAFPTELEFARQACERSSGYTIGPADALQPLFVEY